MKYKNLIFLAMLCLSVYGCSIKYSFTGAKISANAKTFSVTYFPNNAAMVAPTLSSTLTDALTEKFNRQTRLTQVREGGDLRIEGEIVGYSATPAAISGENEMASMYKLTVTVRARFVNSVEPEWSWQGDKTFTQYAEYPATQLLQEVEPRLIPELVELLAEDIFNGAIAQW